MSELDPDSVDQTMASFAIREDGQGQYQFHPIKEISERKLTEGVAIPLLTSRFSNQGSKCPVEGPTLTTANKQHDHTFEPLQATMTNLHSTSAQENIDPAVHEVAHPTVADNDELSKLRTELEAAKSCIARLDAQLSKSKISPSAGDEALGTSSKQAGPDQEHLRFDCKGSGLLNPQRDDLIGGTSTGSTTMESGHSIRRPPINQQTSSERTLRGLTSSNSHLNPGPVDLGAQRVALAYQSLQYSPFTSTANDFAMPTNPARRLGMYDNPWEPGHRFREQGTISRPISALSQYQGSTTGPFTLANGPTEHGCVSATAPIESSSLLPTALPYTYRFSLCGTPAQPPASPWNAQPQVIGSHQTTLHSAEPMNYRRLLDRNMSCDWKHTVDKIICSNDQQASIFLQQKLKVATTDQKDDLIQAIIDQAYALMVNRFGNFLVQRCLEHGSPEQVTAIANVIRGNVLTLSMDAFGCHVIQKAFDVVSEGHKASMVHELLRRIPETVIHRYACHVWQKLFELRWSDSPPQIMKHVNEALRGMWHEVALGETGSLVVQNIFENCLEEDKRPCINEVLTSIDIISHGQFGNWCIQHICEHGSASDKDRAIEHVLHFAAEYSTDQYASKVVEKCLKVGGAEFMSHYLDQVCESQADRPRMPLIDIAGDQYGNYLIQYILMNGSSQHREVVANHVRKHMVSLRGSKFGSRVAMACSNPASATRPGPPTGLGPSARYGSGLYSRAQLGPSYR